VLVLARNDAAARAISARGGLQVEGSPVAEVAVSPRPELLADSDFVLIAVKAPDTEAALRPLRGVLPSATAVVSLQNGLEAVAQITRALGERTPIALGPTTEASLLLGPGHVRRTGLGATTLGWAQGRAGGSMLDSLATLLSYRGLAASVARPIEPHVWAKAVVNAAINPLSALARVSNGALLERPELAERLFAIAREAAAVAAAAGLRLPFDDAAAYVAAVARATAQNRSSMLQDLERGRPTEIDAIDGAIVRAALRLGVAVPETTRVLDEVRARSEA
jgi:2-dehydropantoate 2-reductase